MGTEANLILSLSSSFLSCEMGLLHLASVLGRVLMEGCPHITDVKTKLFNDSNETEILHFENFITSPLKQGSPKGGRGVEMLSQ